MNLNWREILAALPDDGRVDTHTHTFFSDGSDSPAEIVRAALSAGLAGVAISDHDTFDGYRDAIRLFLPPKFLLIPAVELSAYDFDEEIHILGYGFDPEHEELNDYIVQFADRRRERAENIVRSLKNAGIDISWDEIDRKYGSIAIGRMHIARELVACGTCRSLGHAFGSFLGNDSEFVEPKFNISVSAAVALIHRAGGKAVLAHPGALPVRVQVTPLITYGLDGIEASYPFHHPMQERAFVRYCDKRNMPYTGGSDYHGAGRASIRVGTRCSTVANLKKLLLS